MIHIAKSADEAQELADFPSEVIFHVVSRERALESNGISLFRVVRYVHFDEGSHVASS